MVKLIGMLLIATSLLSLIIGISVSYKYSATPSVTGNVVSDTKNTKTGTTFEYLEAIILSFSILSLIMGIMFLFRV